MWTVKTKPRAIVQLSVYEPARPRSCLLAEVFVSVASGLKKGTRVSGLQKEPSREGENGVWGFGYVYTHIYIYMYLCLAGGEAGRLLQEEPSRGRLAGATKTRHTEREREK